MELGRLRFRMRQGWPGIQNIIQRGFESMSKVRVKETVNLLCREGRKIIEGNSEKAEFYNPFNTLEGEKEDAV